MEDFVSGPPLFAAAVPTMLVPSFKPNSDDCKLHNTYDAQDCILAGITVLLGITMCFFGNWVTCLIYVRYNIRVYGCEHTLFNIPVHYHYKIWWFSRPLAHHGNAANLEYKTKEIFSSRNWDLFSCKKILLFWLSSRLAAFPRTCNMGL